PGYPAPMERRRLGRTAMIASVLGFGGSEIGYDRVAVRTVERLLGGALDAGLNVIDTAECYEDGETLIGKAVGARRREFYLFTKCGHPRGWSRGDWRPASLLASIERSLKRLNTEYLDLIQLHSCELGDLETGDAIDADRSHITRTTGSACGTSTIRSCATRRRARPGSPCASR